MASSAPSLLGVIGGSSFLNSDIFQSFQPTTVTTKDGAEVALYLGTGTYRNVVFVQRHVANPNESYSPPHLIQTKAIIQALADMGCKKVIAFGSTGTLKPKELPIGSILIPDDYVSYTNVTSFYDFSKKGHRVPQLNNPLRDDVIKTLTESKDETLSTADAQGGNSRVHVGGVYVQSRGPRFETEAEIRLFAMVGHVIGMTCAHEATLANEAGLQYALICMCDNIANGLASKDFELDDFHKGVHDNQNVMNFVMSLIMKTFTPAAPPSAVEPKLVDLIVSSSYVVTMEPLEEKQDTEDDHIGVLVDHTVVVNEGKIVAVLPSSNIRDAFIAKKNVVLPPGHVLMPGFVNTHTHAGMSLLRGYADDHKLIEWLTQHIWPAEMEWVSPDFVRDSTELSIAEMFRSGTTLFNDMYFFADEAAKLVDSTGIRARIGLIVLEFPSNYAANVDQYLEKGKALFDQYKTHDRVKFCVAPHAPYTVSDESLVRVQTLAQELKVPIHIHLHETEAEVHDSVKGVQNSMSRHCSKELSSPLENFKRLGLLGSSLVAVHMTQLTKDNIADVASSKTNVVHCPTSNMKLAAGMCPVHKLLESGVNVALGTDSCASNNSLDMLAEVKTAAVFAKAVSRNAAAVPAYKALAMATLNGAKALGMDDEVGSLAVGKWADMIAIDISALEVQPVYSVASALVYSASRDNVRDVWVAGQRVLTQRKLTTIDETDLLARTTAWAAKLRDFHQKQKSKPS